MHAYKHTYIHTYIHTNTHTHTLAYMRTDELEEQTGKKRLWSDSRYYSSTYMYIDEQRKTQEDQSVQPALFHKLPF